MWKTGKADCRMVLVYNISGWGRLQDADESAYYEYVRKRADVRVHYCTEQFDNDGSFLSSSKDDQKYGADGRAGGTIT
jgi:hypothetical protein